jgi:REP element-mobilizing transposase RayT
MSNDLTEHRKSQTDFGKIYFWTATIHKWRSPLEKNENKQIIIDSLKYLSDKGLISVYAFVIMPTHIHLICQLNKLNGRESPKASFLKFTAHKLLEQLITDKMDHQFRIADGNKEYEIWQRDPLATEIISLSVARQKLEYIHFNPVSGKWRLSKDDISYYYSSARFYETGVVNFGFLKDLTTAFSEN